MSTVRKKPSVTNKKADLFIEQAGSNLAEGEVKKIRQKKSQVPLVIPHLLLKQLDQHLEASMVGFSRSGWICQAIKEKLNKEESI